MSGYLGFDEPLLRALREATVRAADELEALRCHDIEVASAMRAVAIAGTSLRERWLPIMDSLLGCRAMTGYQPTALGSDIETSWLRSRVASGWHMTTDPLVGWPEPLDAAQVEAFADALTARGPDDGFTDDELGYVRTRFALIASSPQSRATFMAAMTTEAWATTLHILGVEHVEIALIDGLDGEHDRDSRSSKGHLEAIFASAGSMLGNPLARECVDLAAVVDAMPPYAAARFIAACELDGDELAIVARRTIERDREAPYSDTYGCGLLAADLLLPLIERTPDGPRAFVLATSEKPELLLVAGSDPTLANRILVIGTDPANMPIEQARVVVPAFARAGAANGYVGYDDGTENPLRSRAAAEMVAPYLVWFTARHAEEWDLGKREGADILAGLLPGDGAFEAVTAATETAAARLVEQVGAGDHDTRIAAVQDLAALRGLVDTIRREHIVEEAESAQARFDLLWAVIGGIGDVGVDALPLGTLLSGATGLASTLALPALRDLLDEHGWLTAKVDDVRREAGAEYDFLTALGAASVVAVTFDRLVSSGRIPAGTPLPPLPDRDSETAGADYLNAFDTWAGAIADQSAADELRLMKESMLSTHEAEANAHD